MISKEAHCTTSVALEDFMFCSQKSEVVKLVIIKKGKKLVLAEEGKYSAEACPTEPVEPVEGCDDTLVR